MGTINFITCHDCKITRDLDKGWMIQDFETRQEILEECKELKAKEDGKDGFMFRHLLITSFMSAHQAHKCSFFSEHDDELYEACYPRDDQEEPYGYENNDFKWDRSYWE